MSAAEEGRMSPAEDATSRDPQEIRKEIEETRVELGETVSEVAAKADVKKQAKEKADEIKGQAAAKAQELGGKAREIAPDSAGAGMRQAQRVARDNPMPVALAGAFLAGLALGRLTSR